MLQALFKVATVNAPAVVFFDKVDYLTRSRTDDESSFDRRSKNQLLSLFSDFGKGTSVFLMGATNRPWQIDSAFLSRFQQRIFLDLPDDEAKLRMLEHGFQGDSFRFCEDELAAIKHLLGSSECSGRDIEAAMAKLRFDKLRQLRKSSFFAPSGAQGLWEPCASDHPLAKHQPFADWPVEQLVPSTITYTELSGAFGRLKAYERGVEILRSTPEEYPEGLLRQWTSLSPQTSAHVEFNGSNGIASIVIRKGPRPTKGRVVETQPSTLLAASIPQRDYKAAVRMFKGAFSVEIWLEHETDRAQSEIWALVLTSKNNDDRVRSIKGLWEAMRNSFSTMSLRDLPYTNLKRKDEDIGRALPDPPYNFRKGTRIQRSEAFEAHSWSIEIDGREPWFFTNALADPGLVRRVEKITAQRNEDDDEEENRSDDGPSEDEAAGPSAEARASQEDTEQQPVRGRMVPSRGVEPRGARGGRGRKRSREDEDELFLFLPSLSPHFSSLEMKLRENPFWSILYEYSIVAV
ncbi:MAG: hypothetical protein Q9191_000469, partial [Dirinaria sp. TL-2023a]